MDDGTDVDGVGMKIIEMVGEPGDVYLTDIHTFHCAAPNAGHRPRIMVGALYSANDLPMT